MMHYKMHNKDKKLLFLLKLLSFCILKIKDAYFA